MRYLDDANALAFDRKHIWHPYTSATEPLPTQLVESANGVRLMLSDGREVIDGMSSWWSAIHGYNHPRLNQAAKDQIDKMAHVMFGGITHRPAVDLCQSLIEITPENLQHVFLADSGSISVEVAIKMAIQYWQQKARLKKIKCYRYEGAIMAIRSQRCRFAILTQECTIYLTTASFNNISLSALSAGSTNTLTPLAPVSYTHLTLPTIYSV